MNAVALDFGTYADLHSKRDAVKKVVEQHNGEGTVRVVLEENLSRARLGINEGMNRPVIRGDRGKMPVNVVVKMKPDSTLNDMARIQKDIENVLGKRVSVKSEGSLRSRLFASAMKKSVEI